MATMGYRFVNSGKFMPAGLVATLRYVCYTVILIRCHWVQWNFWYWSELQYIFLKKSKLGRYQWVQKIFCIGFHCSHVLLVITDLTFSLQFRTSHSIGCEINVNAAPYMNRLNKCPLVLVTIIDLLVQYIILTMWNAITYYSEITADMIFRVHGYWSFT